MPHHISLPPRTFTVTVLLPSSTSTRSITPSASSSSLGLRCTTASLTFVRNVLNDQFPLHVEYLPVHHAREGLIVQILIIGEFPDDHAASAVRAEQTGNLSEEEHIAAKITGIFIGYSQVSSSLSPYSWHFPYTACLLHNWSCTRSNLWGEGKDSSRYRFPAGISGIGKVCCPTDIFYHEQSIYATLVRKTPSPPVPGNRHCLCRRR
jgi:hypothetical protein